MDISTLRAHAPSKGKALIDKAQTSPLLKQATESMLSDVDTEKLTTDEEIRVAGVAQLIAEKQKLVASSGKGKTLSDDEIRSKAEQITRALRNGPFGNNGEDELAEGRRRLIQKLAGGV